jgi:hypothetical protein
MASELAVPIVDGDQLVGVINLEHTTPCHFKREHQVLVQTLALQGVITTKEGGVGVGVGLPMARRIAEGHYGRLGFSNVAGGGAEFVVTVPIRTASLPLRG